MNKFSRIALKTILWIIGSVIALLLLAIFLIRLPSVQNFIAGKVANYVEGKIGTPFHIGSVNIEFPKKLVLENIYLEDQSKDTLVAGEAIKVDISMMKLLKNTIEIQQLEASGITAKIRRSMPDSSFNFDYIVKAFASPEEDKIKSDTSSAMVFNLDKVLFERFHVVYADDVIGTSADVYLKHFDTQVKKFDLTKNMAFDMPKVNIDGLAAIVTQWNPVKDGAGPSVEDFGITDSTAIATFLLPDIGINTADLKNINVKYEDKSSKLRTRFAIDKLYAEINKVDLNKEIVDIQKISLAGSDAEVLFDKIAQVKKTTTADKKATSSSSTKINWVVSAQDIDINDTKIRYKDDNEPRIKGFDYFNIKIPAVTASMTDLFYSADSISGSLKSLIAKDQSGLEIKNLKGDFIYTNTGAEIKNLYAATPRTLLQDYIKVTYPSIEAVVEKPELLFVNANIKKSHVDMRDIYYFAPFLDTMEVMKPLMDKKFNIDGKVIGKINDLNISHLDFSTLSNTKVLASGRIKGLPNIEKMTLDLNIKRFTSGKSDIEKLVAKSMFPKNLELPNAIGLTGTFKGGMQAFDTDMSLVTEKGTAKVNGNFAMTNRDTTYDAFVSIKDFDIGKILKQDSTLGILSFEANVKGHGLDPKKAMANIDGKLIRLDALGYQYHNIDMNMDANQGDIQAKISSDDPNISFNLAASADMKNKYPKVNFELMVDSVNLKNLHLMEEDFRYHGKLVGNFETADPNYLNGEAHISNSSIAYNNDRYTLDSISFIAKSDTSSNLLMVKSSFLNAHLIGKYKIMELGSAVQDIVHAYYQPGAPITIPKYEDQQFEFSAQLTRTKFIKDFLPDLTEMKDITLDGMFNSKSKLIQAKLNAPKIVYAGTDINSVSLDLTTVDSTMYYSALINKIKVSNIELINTVFSGKVVKNNMDFGLWIKDKKDKEQYHLGANMKVDQGNFLFSLMENGLMLNYDKWDVDSTNVLSFGKSGMQAKNFRLENKGQLLEIKSQDSVLNSPIDLLFKNFRIETLSKMVAADNMNLGGGINGQATISRLESNPVFVSDIVIEKFYLGKDTVGNINIKVNNEKENTYAANVSITENGNNVSLIGEFISPPKGKATFDAVLNIAPLQMKTVQAFSLGYLKESKGEVQGELKISGTTDRPIINGDLNFNAAEFNVAMLNAAFFIDDEKIRFTDKGISLSDFDVKDKKGNIGTLNGAINTSNYIDYGFNLDLKTNNFEVVNSTRQDNDLFFGKMYVSSDLKIRGTLDKPVVDGNIKVQDKTDFVFIMPNDNPGMVERKGVVEFVDKSDTTQANIFAQLDSLTTTKLTGLDVTLNLQTDKNAKFKIILDEGSQDALNIQGEAELNAGIDPSNKMTMSGTYTVDKGSYSFSFGPVKREFTFKEGSTITWAGDPLDARMDITAVYKVKAPTLELVQTQLGSENSNLYKQRVPFNVNLLITEQLFQPKLGFDIDLDENNAIVSQDVVSKVNNGLAQLREDPSEMNKQVFSLIVLGRFLASNPFESLSGGGGVESMARNSVSSLLTSQLNRLASDLIKGVELDFDLQSAEDYTTGVGQTRTDLNIGVSKMLFNDRLKITIGSNFEVEGNSRPGEQAANIAGDISLDYQLSVDGRYFARVYRKNQYQVTLQGQYVETGIGFIINMNYNKFKEIWMNSKQLTEYNTNSRGFRKRFNVERMETDSVYRDSVRYVIRDSIMRHDPKKYKERYLSQPKKESIQKTNTNNKTDSTKQKVDTIGEKVIRNEEKENNEKK
ncbi:translocation/assembly module TamB domain-containing protein [Sphingobacterium sp. SRCM116780]|uniref:translocation/assembly module TamB domain-containing protein n=1 Tax=Sphingobacterium sp. SRCM116780 TaxID=2907623 RepID=UPI001F37106E|nr:translocation/assembly module TamB [Sphingobacterium sp. SRCM116780]UIR54700.1 translocation/assembly module TamB domain-containing protein [Sphingobacterium sp. SRCM116780]